MARFSSIMMFAAVTVLVAASPTTFGASKARELSRTLPELKLEDVALVDALDFVQDLTGANLFVNWNALEAAGIAKDTTVNVNLRKVSLRKALDIILAQASTADVALTYEYDEGVLEITTRALADEKVYTKVYPVEDLIMEIPNFEGPNLNLSSATQGNNGGGQGGGQNGGGGGGGNTLFETDQEDNDKETSKTRDERGEDLVELIKETIAPDMWDNGKCSIRFFNGSLIVTAPRSVHEAIGGSF